MATPVTEVTPTFAEEAHFVLDEAGIPYDRGSLQQGTYRNFEDDLVPFAVAHDPDALTHIYVDESPYYNEEFEHNYGTFASYTPEQFLLRGLLVYQYTFLNHKANKDFPGFNVEILSAAGRVNQVQELLGRNPGVDALKLVQGDVIGRKFTTAEYINSFAKGEVPIPPPLERKWAKHDLDLTSHTQGWLSMPPLQSQQVQTAAQALQDRFGETLVDRPKPARDFVGALDGWGEFKTPILFSSVTLVDCEQSFKGESSQRTKDLQIAMRRCLQDRIGQGLDPRDLKILGMIEGDKHVKEQSRRVVKAVVAHLAGLMLKLEEVKPREDDTENWQKIRQDWYESLVEQYGDSELAA